MSKIADDVHSVLKQLFPYDDVVSEHYVYYKGTRLFFDFYLRKLSILFEVQGAQHTKYIRHFHGSVEMFREQKRRDNLKLEYVANTPPLTLVYFYDKLDKITKELVMQRIYKAQQGVTK
ncbi:MAG TPA: hypothetical protein VI911_07840 [Patescibacteria group bacterium]|nr:hypothetical protein [Patescibacteria group bacterium]